MIHGESRFFTNWQMPKEVSSKLMTLETEGEQLQELRAWVESTKIKERIQFRLEDQKEQDHLYNIITQFTQNNFMFCK